ncbi:MULTISPECIES: hypothetical protein [Nostocales]|uniref:SH3b domain-containing protein n=3 Tax=Nostocales TaxID=1161 RepID=A0A8S9SSP1_9CYAN|nr:hypothetical protein [Tolypothrix bouteillei]KAF3883901.1 hypothetical protein DA73_0400040055 [Tolypothrix bouteillei VB521301]
MNFKLTALGILALASISIATPTLAQQLQKSHYKAGELMVTLGSDDSYQGCDRENKCITLHGSETVVDKKYSGKRWLNGEYIYAISWHEGKGENMRLSILKNNRRIFTSELVPFSNLKWERWCDITGVYTGQLPVLYSPAGKSKAALNNGNIVRAIRQKDDWTYVEVARGPNTGVNRVRGWVDSHYLECTKEASN